MGESIQLLPFNGYKTPHISLRYHLLILHNGHLDIYRLQVLNNAITNTGFYKSYILQWYKPMNGEL